MSWLKRSKGLLRVVCVYAIVSFLSSAIFPANMQAAEITLPAPNQFVQLSGAYSFPTLKGLKFNPAAPFEMKFIIDTGDVKTISKEDAAQLIRYFLAGLTIPEKDLWVNMSPYEQDKMITPNLAVTDLGKDLLSQDYILKQISASLTYPEGDIGKDFWARTYDEVLKIAKTTNLPINTYNKIWIVPDKAVVYENSEIALITEATLRTMLEEDYLALKSNVGDIQKQKKNLQEELIEQINKVSSNVVRQVILPKINQDVNSGKNFAALRQIHHSLILAAWFKEKFKDSIYKYYIDKGKVKGIDLADKGAKEKIYNLYVEAFKKGIYNYIKTDTEPQTRRKIKRQYFSGGFAFKSPDGKIIDNRLSLTDDNEPKIISSALGANQEEDVVMTVRQSPIVQGEAAQRKPATAASALATAPTIRTELTVPEGQPQAFFTSDYHGYTINGLLAKPIEQIPDAVVNAVRIKLDQDVAQGKILSALVIDSAGTDIDVQVTHRYGENNAAVQRLILEAIKEGALKAQGLGLLRKGVDVNSMDLADLAKALRLKYQPHSITERGSEPVVIAKIIGAGIGAANIKLYHEFFIPGATPLQKLGFVPVVGEKDKNVVRGFRAVVRRVDDVLKGNFDGPVWEFEKSAAANVKGKVYPSKDESLELMALASQPNDFVITAIYPVEGSLLSSNEPVVSVVYQPVYGETGSLRTLNPTFICKSQSGADAVGGIASMFYDVNFVPGGKNGEHYVATRPVTLKEARKAPKEGTANVVVYGWQSKGNGIIPQEKDGVMDHVAINPPALTPERKLADWLASIMVTHQYDQPYLTPFAAQEQVESIRKAQNHLFTRAPKEADVDIVMDEVETKVANGEFLSVTDDKADMGGKFGHNFTPEYMLAIDRATAMEAVENGLLSDGNIIGFTDKMRLKRGTTVSIGDDSHVLMLGDKSRNSAESHQLSFLAFTRGYYAAVVNGEKPYGLAQDYQGKEAKAAKANPVFYSHFTPRFFEILREVMPLDYMNMVDKMEAGWKKWQETSETVKLPDPFSGNVSQQGIGSARYLMDVANGERQFGILAGDKMGPAALNRIIREAVYAALKAGQFANGLVFEIWDAKAFDEHGNISADEIPESYADIADAVNELKDKSEQDFIKASYLDGKLRKDYLRRAGEKNKLAELIKKAGFVPTKRIYLDAQSDKDAIYRYLADSDRFNIKQVWAKKRADWDINSQLIELEKDASGKFVMKRRPGTLNLQDYLDRPVLGSSVTKLGILAGGEYIGKDDPVMVGHIKLMEHVFAFLRVNPLIIQGDMNGSHWLAAIPTASKYAVANKESHPILVGQVYTLSTDGKTLANVEDVFGKKEYAPIRNKMFKFNFEFKKAQLGGQFEPYGTNWRTVEASYPLAKLLRALQEPHSPFLVNNKPEAERQTRPTGIVTATAELFQAATASSGLEALTVTVNGNWKKRPFKDEEAARAKAREFRAELAEIGTKARMNLFVEDKWTKAIAEEWEGSNINVGVQSFHFDPAGTSSIDVINQQIEEAVQNGDKIAMLGHSMHRFPDPKVLPDVVPLTNERANQIVKAILADGRLKLLYVIGVDEYLDETGIPLPITLPKQRDYIRRQIFDAINIGLDGVTPDQVSQMMVTPEPIHDISTKAGDGTIDPKTKVNFPKVDLLAQFTNEAIRQKFGDNVKVSTGYGASAGPDTAETLLSHEKVFNIIPGGKSLEVKDFKAMVLNAIKGKASVSPSDTASSSLTSTPGGIDLGGINVKAAAGSSPVSLKGLPAIDLLNVEGFTFEIMGIQPFTTPNLNAFFGIVSKENKQANENEKLALKR